MLFAGFSFGSSVGLRTCCGDPRVQGHGRAGPARKRRGARLPLPFLASCSQPKLFISGTQDQYGPRQRSRQSLPARLPRRSWCWSEGADHFFAGKLDRCSGRLHAWVETSLSHDP